MRKSTYTRAAIAAGAVTAVAVAAGAAAVIGGGVALARRAVTPARVPDTPVTVLGLFRSTQHSYVLLHGTDAELPGRYSFLFHEERGHARVGEIVPPARARALTGEELAPGTVLREVLDIAGETLAEGSQGRITGWWFRTPEELGLRTERITYPTELGEAEAWIITPRRRARHHRWAVHVHGRGAAPAETLRGVLPCARAGITSLVISYRNDPTGPVGEHGRYGIGLSESRDVSAAIAEAIRRGAERVTLFGWSMGATACLLAGTEGPFRGVVDGFILDSPAINWRDLLRYHAMELRVPEVVSQLGISLLDRGVVRSGEPDRLSFERLTPEAFAAKLEVPVLIHASTADTFVPCTAAEHLAAAAPALVQLRLQERGEHVKLWNVDAEPWERSTEVFARALPHPPWRGEVESDASAWPLRSGQRYTSSDVH